MNKYVVSAISLLLLFVLAIQSCQQENPAAIPDHLQCEYLINPLGVDNRSPRLRWEINSATHGLMQHSYRVWVGTDSVEVANGTGALWDTKRISDQAMQVQYQGDSLKPFTKYFWSVESWFNDGKTNSRAAVASFETGMMGMSNWEGKWITDANDIDVKPAPYFRKVFTAAKRIKQARLYVAAAGLFEVFINGKRVGDHRLDPMYTRFDKRSLYVTYDVSALVASNAPNALGIVLGNGWYNHQSTAVWDFHKALWRNRPRVCLNMRITYDDNSTEVISTDEHWKTSPGPIVFNSIYTAEHYDARLEQTGWNTTSFDETPWTAARTVASPSANLVSQVLQPIRHVEEIQPVTFRKVTDQKYVYDLGRNISGVVRLRVTGERGTELRLSHAEILDSAGNIDQSNIDVHYRPTDDSDPFQTDIFILKGEGEEVFLPVFNYKGFQYVEITSSKPIALSKESLTGIFMHSDVEPVGQIESSNETMTKIWRATNNAYLSNLFGYPTDCPQREKNGWTGDAHIAIETGLYNFDGITIYEKWLADHRDEQQPNGVLPAIIPTSGWGYEWGNGPDWTSTIAIIPWNIYLFYGDRKLLTDCYDNIKRYVDHIDEMSPTGLTDWGLGDWVPVKSVSPKELTSSLYYYTDANILSKAATILGKFEDAEQYTALAKKIADAINAKYLNTTTGMYGSGLQTELSAPLYWGIVPKNIRPKVIENLVKRVEADQKHIDVGLLGTKTILNALSENGHADLAYEVASQETFPSWGFWIKNGATTLFENWPIDAKSDISRNHIMFGEIGAWLFKAPGGIKPDPEAPGFKHVLLQPYFVPGLDFFTAKHTGPYGEIISSWKRSNGNVTYTVTIPPNSTGTLKLDGKHISETNKSGTIIAARAGDAGILHFTLELVPGTYVFTIEL